MKLTDVVAIWDEIPTYNGIEPLDFKGFAMAVEVAVGIEYNLGERADESKKRANGRNLL